jgi:hypothetical protein
MSHIRKTVALTDIIFILNFNNRIDTIKMINYFVTKNYISFSRDTRYRNVAA